MAFILNEWFKILQPTPWGERTLMRGVSDGTYMYISGGWDTVGSYYRRRDVWKSENGINWSLVTDSPGWAKRSGHGFIYFGGKFYIMGGNNETDGELNDVWVSDDAENWTNLGTAGWSARHEFTLTEHDGKMWVIGGYNTGYLSDVWSSADGISWTSHTSLPIAVREHAAISFLGKLLVIGGDSPSFPFFSNTIYSTVNGSSWTTEGTGAFPVRREHQVVKSSDDDRIAIVGGYGSDGGFHALKDVWQSSDGITWTSITQVQEFTERSDLVLVNHNGRVYIIGGISDFDGSVLDDVYSSELENAADFYADDTDVTTSDDVEFTDNSTGTPVAWLWDFGDGDTSTDQNPTHKYSRTGVYDVSLTVTYGDSTEKSRTRADYITVGVGDIDFTGTPLTGNIPLQVSFEAEI